MVGDRQHEKGKLRPGFLSILWLLVLIYPLSSGPVCRVIEAGHLPEEIYILYYPLADLTAHSPQLQKCLRWYMRDIWGWGPECMQP